MKLPVEACFKRVFLYVSYVLRKSTENLSYNIQTVIQNSDQYGAAIYHFLELNVPLGSNSVMPLNSGQV